MPTAIWWLRRDLRLHDNPALHAAARQGGTVIPLFILDEGLLAKYGAAEKRLAFLFASLRTVDEALRERGSRLILRRGDPQKVLPKFVEETGAGAVFAQEDTHPDALERDQALAEQVPLTLIEGTLIRPAGTVLKDDGDPYVVFTPFKRTSLGQPLPGRADLLAPPERLDTPTGLSSEPIPDGPSQTERPHFPPGVSEARRRLAAFVEEGLAAYNDRRDTLAAEGTSALSPYFRFGLLSAREAAVEAIEARTAAGTQAAREGAETWLSELIWRDFYNHIEYHFPHVHRGNFNSAYDGLAWRNDEAAFAAWCQGRTGFPVVDAAMRQLNQSGWMHNRGRMVVASFLVKDLLIDWRWGEQYFMDRLVDGDPAANNGGWQWAAGTGTDAAPYFRIFNPVSQSQKHDPNGAYIRRWVTELEGLDDKGIHEPWKLSDETLEKAGIRLGRDYPRPIVDHKAARERTLAAYKKARGG